MTRKAVTTLEFYNLWIMFTYKLIQQSAFKIGQNK